MLLASYSPEFDNQRMMGALLGKVDFATVEEAKHYISRTSSQAASMISDEEYALFLKRPTLNLGRGLELNQYHHGSRAVLLGDAAHPFPPSGNGATLAMMGALNLTEKLKLHSLPEGLAQYSTTQRREAAGGILLSQLGHVLFILLTTFFYSLGGIPHTLGQLIFKSAIPFQDIRSVIATALAFARALALALLLAGSFSLVLGGLFGVIRLLLMLCLMTSLACSHALCYA